MSDNSPKALRRSIEAIDRDFHRLLRDAPWKQRKQGCGPRQTTQDKTPDTERQAVPVTNIPPAPSNPKQPEESRNKSRANWDAIKVILEIVAIPFAIAYAVVTGLMWWDAHRNFKTDERAWIGFKVANIIRVEPNQVAEFEVVITNTGKTPGHVDQGIVLFAERPKSNDIYQFGSHPLDSDISVHGSELSQILLFPQGEIRAPAISPHPLSDAEMSALASGEARLRISGIIHYTDIFRTHHTTTYCFVWQPPTAKFAACKNHNDAD